jgi:hypothetical protein
MTDGAVLNHRHRGRDMGFKHFLGLKLEGQHHAFAGTNRFGAGHPDFTVLGLLDDDILKSPQFAAPPFGEDEPRVPSSH